MWKEFFKHNLAYLYAFAGIIFIFLSFLVVQDISKGTVALTQTVRVPTLLFGVLFVALSLLTDASPVLSWTGMLQVHRTPRGFMVRLRHADIEVCFGRLEESCQEFPAHLVALPANNQFDDECMSDLKSSLGAFVNSYFPNRLAEMKALVRTKLNSAQQCDAPDQESYPMGTYVYFERPLSQDVKLAFVAVTTKVQDEGIICESPNIFDAVQGIHRLMNNERIGGVILPLLGSGHGGLSPEISLLCMLIAFAETVRRPSGHHIGNVRIVVFQRNDRAKPQISMWRVRKLLALVKQYCER